MAGACGISPYWGMTFPRQWPNYDQMTYIDKLPAAQQARWKRHYLMFLKKLTWFSGKRPVLKSPNNTGRVAVLRGMFPRARFVHLYRDPEVVYLSNMRLAREAHVMNQLQDPQPDTSYQARFLENYAAMETAFYRDTADLPPGCVAEVCFEDLEASPIEQLRRVYAVLGLEWTDTHQQRLERYLAGLAGYQKTRHKRLTEFERRQIRATMLPFMQRWGYEAAPVTRRKAA
jgi:hypothetical protein